MSDHSLGSLEETILVIVLMQDESYGVEIAKIYEEHVQQSISLPAIHVVLKRLEKKGLVKSFFGEPTAERGGKRKKYYQGTPSGYKVAEESQQRRSQMWSLVPNAKLSYAHI